MLAYIRFNEYIASMLQPELILRALADPTRLRLINLLTQRDELCVCEFTGVLAMAQPKVSRHLAVLRDANLVLVRREGVWIYYRLHPDLPAWVERILEGVKTGLQGKQPYNEDNKQLDGLSANLKVACQ